MGSTNLLNAAAAGGATSSTNHQPFNAFAAAINPLGTATGSKQTAGSSNVGKAGSKMALDKILAQGGAAPSAGPVPKVDVDIMNM